MTTNTEYFRPADSKTVVGVSRSTIYEWVKQKRLKIHKVGNMSFIRMDDVRKIIEPMGDQMGD